jgi:predicted PurR-regulated permease PerM
VTLNLAKTAYTLLIVGIVILLLQFMQPVLIPLVLAALLFYALDPSVDWFEASPLPRAIGAASMLLIVLSACGALAYSLQNQAMTVVDELPTGARKLAASLRRPRDCAGRARKSATGCRCSAVG